MPKKWDEDEVAAAIKSYKSRLQSILTRYTSPRWHGESISLGKGTKPASVTAEHRKSINRIGRSTGCHKCLLAPRGPWIVDHIPPRGLKAGIVENYVPGWIGSKSYRFFAHCSACAKAQSKLVRKLNKIWKSKGTLPDLSTFEAKLIHHDNDKLSVVGQSGAPRLVQRFVVQNKGRLKGCHCCKTRKSSSGFIADHYPPQEFATNYMLDAVRLLKLRRPAWQLRPQCQICSNRQGGIMAKFAGLIRKDMIDAGYPVYK